MSAESPAESSSQALERFLASELDKLNLTVPSDDVEYMSRLIEEEGMEREERLEGVRGMLEGVVEGGELPADRVDDALERVIDEWERLRAEEAERAAAGEDSEEDEAPKPSDILATLTPEELEMARRQALLQQYGYVDESPDDSSHAAVDGPPRGQTAREREEKKAQEERQRMIMEALRLDGRKKKHKKQQEVDLLAPNLNRAKVQMRAQIERDASKQQAQLRKDRDKAALDKQRADQAKAKADKQKKAAKQERRA